MFFHSVQKILAPSGLVVLFPLAARAEFLGLVLDFLPKQFINEKGNNCLFPVSYSV
jgi:hypothetical protein